MDDWLGLVAPEVVKFAYLCRRRIMTRASKEPEISAAISPAYGGISASGDVRSGRHTLCAIDAGLAFIYSLCCVRIRGIRPAHPCPFFGRGAEFPKIIEPATCSGRIKTLSAEEP